MRLARQPTVAAGRLLEPAIASPAASEAAASYSATTTAPVCAWSAASAPVAKAAAPAPAAPFVIAATTDDARLLRCQQAAPAASASNTTGRQVTWLASTGAVRGLEALHRARAAYGCQASCIC